MRAPALIERLARRTRVKKDDVPGRMSMTRPDLDLTEKKFFGSRTGFAADLTVFASDLSVIHKA